jgi:hypothetical protein
MKALGNRKKHEGLTPEKKTKSARFKRDSEQAGKVVRTFNVANLLKGPIDD